MKTVRTMQDYLNELEEKNGSLDQAESCVEAYAERGHLSNENLWSLLKLLRSYEKRAKPGNHYWNKLEQDYGYVLDWQPSDTGMSYYDNART